MELLTALAVQIRMRTGTKYMDALRKLLRDANGMNSRKLSEVCSHLRGLLNSSTLDLTCWFNVYMWQFFDSSSRPNYGKKDSDKAPRRPKNYETHPQRQLAGDAARFKSYKL